MPVLYFSEKKRRCGFEPTKYGISSYFQTWFKDYFVYKKNDINTITIDCFRYNDTVISFHSVNKNIFSSLNRQELISR